MDVLTEARAERDRVEQEERDRVVAEIRERLMPFVIRDIAGTLTKQDASTLIEILDDLNLTDDEYNEIRAVAVAAAKDARHLAHSLPMLESESIRFARFAIARRRAERELERANNAMRRASSLATYIRGYEHSLESKRESHPFLFDGDELLHELVAAVPELPQPTEAETRTCPICLTDFAGTDTLCTPRCATIAQQHGDVLIQLGVLPGSKKKR